jgi:hypothetical protein
MMSRVIEGLTEKRLNWVDANRENGFEEEQFEQATNERIQKMRRSQIASAEADYSKQIQELDIALERADIIAGPVAYGVIDVLEERS